MIFFSFFACLRASAKATSLKCTSASEMEEEIKKADWVISRNGYSTVMDLMKLQKRSVLIPTPGQTEQEYLATYLMEKGLAFSRQQKDFTLTEALEKAAAPIWLLRAGAWLASVRPIAAPDNSVRQNSFRRWWCRSRLIEVGNPEPDRAFPRARRSTCGKPGAIDVNAGR